VIPIVVDASAALKWVVEEEGSDAAAALSQQELLAPSLMMAECANALWAKARRGELSASEVIERIHALFQAPVELVPLEPLIEPAIELALHRIRGWEGLRNNPSPPLGCIGRGGR
jgi:predicted nucleic acid-binding protein